MAVVWKENDLTAFVADKILVIGRKQVYPVASDSACTAVPVEA
jgi:hypothetical protein